MIRLTPADRSAIFEESAIAVTDTSAPYWLVLLLAGAIALLWGVDLAGDFAANENLSFSGSYSERADRRRHEDREKRRTVRVRRSRFTTM